MSDVSFIRAAPAAPVATGRRSAEAPAEAEEKPVKAALPPPDLHSKTKVKTEQRSAFAYSYTFIDTDTGQVVSRWPVAPPIDGNSIPGAKLSHTL